MKINQHLFSLLFLAISLTSLQAQKYPPLALNVSEAAKLDSYIQHYLDQGDIPGLSLAVVQGDELVYSKGYGFRSMDTKEKVDEETIFSAASLSKALFSYGVLKLMEAGKIDLDKPLYQYLPYEDLQHDDRYKKITARMAMSHSSGLPNWRNGRQLNLEHEPGAQFEYSGEGFVYLMRVVEKITGKSLEEYMQESVFKPLGMTRSSYVWQPSFDDNAAIPHDQLAHTYPLNKPETGNSAYSLQTTAIDYSKFIRALLNNQGLKAETIQAMLTHQVSVTKEGDAEHGGLFWGLGIGLQETSDGPAFWHWGDNGTFKCFVIAYPNQKVGMVYFTNSSNGLGVARDLVTGILGGNYPSIRWIDYDGPDAPAHTLLKSILKSDVEKAIRPYLAENGLHQDTAQLNESSMNRLGYTLLGLGKIGAAAELFRMNTLAFPNSANVYDSYGEALLRKGNLKEAAINYAQALKFDPDNETAKAIVYQINEGNKTGKQTFSLASYPNAKYVSLAGEFNGWNMLKNPMIWENGRWICRIDLEPGTYQYKFVVDGVWILDPANSKSIYEGNHNSVVEIK